LIDQWDILLRTELTGLTKLFDALRVSVCSSQSLFGSLLQHGSLLEPCTFIYIFFRMGVAFFHVGISPAVM